MATCSLIIQRSLEIAEELFSLADDGEAEGCDEGYNLLSCILRDCSYRIKAQAEKQKELHCK